MEAAWGLVRRVAPLLLRQRQRDGVVAQLGGGGSSRGRHGSASDFGRLFGLFIGHSLVPASLRRVGVDVAGDLRDKLGGGTVESVAKMRGPSSCRPPPTKMASARFQSGWR